MKGLNLFTGGSKILNQDIDYIQMAIREGIEDIVKGIARGHDYSDPIVLHGVWIQSPASNAVVSAGVIFYNNELFRVDAATLSGSGTLNFVISETYDASNPIQFFDGNLRNVHYIRKLVPTYGTGDFAASTLVYRASKESGKIAYFAGDTNADKLDWLFADGRALNIADYPDLYRAIGQYYTAYPCVRFSNRLGIDRTDGLLVRAGATIINAAERDLTELVNGVAVRFYNERNFANDPNNPMATNVLSTVYDTTYYLRFQSIISSTFYTYSVHPTEADALANTNEIDFSTLFNTGSNQSITMQIEGKFKLPKLNHLAVSGNTISQKEIFIQGAYREREIFSTADITQIGAGAFAFPMSAYIHI